MNALGRGAPAAGRYSKCLRSGKRRRRRLQPCVSPVTTSRDQRALRLGRVLKGAAHRTLRGLGRVQARLKAVSLVQLSRELGAAIRRSSATAASLELHRLVLDNARD